jgi:hypothetical protein
LSLGCVMPKAPITESDRLCADADRLCAKSQQLRDKSRCLQEYSVELTAKSQCLCGEVSALARRRFHLPWAWRYVETKE